MSVAAYTGFSEETEIRRLRTLYQLLTAITGAKKLEDIYEASITSLLAGTLANRAAILTFDEDGVMRFRAWRDLSAEYRQAATGYTPWRQESPVAAGSRGLARGLIFQRDGALVVSVVQEGLVRVVG